jgi:hypothetical protein
MTAKAPQSMPEMFKRHGDNNHIPAARPAASAAPPARASAKALPTFFTLKSIIMDDKSLSAEQKISLLDKISNLY